MPEPNYVSEIEREDGTILTIKDAEARAEIAEQLEQVNTNTSILSQTYNSADCNVSVFLRQDNGAIDESTYYNTSESKMHFRMHWSKNQLVYWDVEDEVYTNKYRYEYFGVIATNNVNKSTWLTIDIPEVANETYVKKTTTTDTTNLPNVDQGGYTWNKSSVNVGDIWYIRPYVVMTDLQFGNQFIKYGAVYKVTAGVPCTIECDTLSCTELTTREQANENSISLLNKYSGGKNCLNYTLDTLKSLNTSGTWSGNTYTWHGITFTLNRDMTIAASGTNDGTGDCLFMLAMPAPVKYESYGSGCPSGGSSSTYELYFGSGAIDYGSGVYVGVGPKYPMIRIYSGVTAPTAPFKPMICIDEDWTLSHDYQPYAPSNAELYRIIGDINTILEEVL